MIKNYFVKSYVQKFLRKIIFISYNLPNTEVVEKNTFQKGKAMFRQRWLITARSRISRPHQALVKFLYKNSGTSIYLYTRRYVSL